MPDAVIIGAGPAGCIAAIMLARAKWDVRLIEQHRFPRDKVCGECLSALGADVLDRLGQRASFQKLSPVQLTRALIHSPSGGTLQVALSRPMWGVSRLRMDQWLIELARDAGVQVLQPVRCEQIVPRDTGLRPVRKDVPTQNPPSLRASSTGRRPVSRGSISGGTPSTEIAIRDLLDNRVRKVEASWTLLADGKCSLLEPRPRPTNDLGLKAHFQKLDGPRDAIELFGVDGHYGGAAPIEGGLWNVAFSVPRRRIQQAGGDLDGMFERIITENTSLRRRFRGAHRVTEWLASPLPRFPIARQWPDGIIPLGNAAAAIEPVGGEGMGLAMRSAELAATMLLSSDVNIARLRQSFQQLWRTRSLSCRATAKVVSHPMLASWVAPIGRFKIASGSMMRLMGKTSS